MAAAPDTPQALCQHSLGFAQCQGPQWLFLAGSSAWSWSLLPQLIQCWGTREVPAPPRAHQESTLKDLILQHPPFPLSFQWELLSFPCPKNNPIPRDGPCSPGVLWGFYISSAKLSWFPPRRDLMQQGQGNNSRSQRAQTCSSIPPPLGPPCQAFPTPPMDQQCSGQAGWALSEQLCG